MREELQQLDANYRSQLMPTVEEAEREIREAIGFHIGGLIEDGLPVPLPVSIVEYLEIAA